MKAFVINLERSTERREHVQAQLLRSGLEHEFVAAVDGRAFSDDEVAAIADADAVARFPDWLTRPVLATALSHAAVYDRVIAQDCAHALVLEDDAALPAGAGLQALLDELEGRVSGREVVLLYYFGDPHRASRLQDGGEPRLAGRWRLLEPEDRGDLRSAAAYVVTREACRSLLAALRPVHAAADAWGTFLMDGTLERVRCVYPAPISVSTRFASTLDHHSAGSLSASLSERAQRHRSGPLALALRLNRVWIRMRSRRFVVTRCR
jgi:glycosyl transferase family 25